jgi:hypothetical protein
MDDAEFRQRQEVLRFFLKMQSAPPEEQDELWQQFSLRMGFPPAGAHTLETATLSPAEESARRRILSRGGLDAMLAEYRRVREEFSGTPELAVIDASMSQMLFSAARVTIRHSATCEMFEIYVTHHGFWFYDGLYAVAAMIQCGDLQRADRTLQLALSQISRLDNDLQPLFQARAEELRREIQERIAGGAAVFEPPQ